MTAADIGMSRQLKVLDDSKMVRASLVTLRQIVGQFFAERPFSRVVASAGLGAW